MLFAAGNIRCPSNGTFVPPAFIRCLYCIIRPVRTASHSVNQEIWLLAGYQDRTKKPLLYFSLMESTTTATQLIVPFNESSLSLCMRKQRICPSPAIIFCQVTGTVHFGLQIFLVERRAIAPQWDTSANIQSRFLQGSQLPWIVGDQCNGCGTKRT
ncbi:hypothetical protein D3C74_379000 [compost metagenome]